MSNAHTSLNEDSNSLQVEMCILFSVQVLISSTPMTAKAPCSYPRASSVLPWDLSCAQKLEGGKESHGDKTQSWRLLLVRMQCLLWAVWPHAPCQWKTARSLLQKNDRELLAFCFFISFHNLELQKASSHCFLNDLCSQFLCQLGIDSNSNFLIYEHGDCWDKVKTIHSWE